MEFLVEVITNLGYPIAMSVGLFWYLKYTNDRYFKQIDTMTNSHKEEMTEITQALNNNTIVMQKICDRLDVNENE